MIHESAIDQNRAKATDLLNTQTSVGTMAEVLQLVEQRNNMAREWNERGGGEVNKGLYIDYIVAMNARIKSLLAL